MKWRVEEVHGDEWVDMPIRNEQICGAECLAEIAAKEYFDHHDGWEDSWPLVIWVNADHLDGPTACEVKIEHEPTFVASLHPTSPTQQSTE